MTEPLLPDTTSDESEVGWGDDAGQDRERKDVDDDERFLAERPPHHDR